MHEFNSNAESGLILRLPRLIGDGKRLQQVLTIIVNNVLKCTDCWGAIFIEASFCEQKSLLKVNVIDTRVETCA